MGRTVLAASVLILLASLPWPSEATATGIVVEPQRVGIDLLYDGTTVEVRAEVPAGYEAAVRLLARPERLELKRLGKRAGVLWMRVGNVTFEHVPAVYQVLTSAPLADIGSPTVLAEWRLGYESLLPDQVPGSGLRAELVALKEHEGLFALREGALGRGGAGAPPQGPLRGTFRLPASAPAGDYGVDLIGFKDRRAVHLGSATLHLEHVGAVGALRRLASYHGLAYGITACLIAIIVGLVTGLLFRPKSDESH